MAIDFSVFGAFVEGWVICNVNSIFVVTVHDSRRCEIDLKILEKLLEPCEFTD